MAAAISVCLWNYMGWDNASTVAQEVENPQRTLSAGDADGGGAGGGDVYAAAGGGGRGGDSGGAVFDRRVGRRGEDAGRHGLVGRGAGLAVVLGGTISGVGMFNALMMSYTRIPYALAEERLLPQAFARVTKNGVPWLSVALCAIAWGLAVQMSFERLISIDLVLYGASLLLEFVALVVLRVREPAMVRPFRVPGGMFGAVAAGVGPALLIAFAMWAARGERVAGMPALAFAAIVAACGPVLYGIARRGAAGGRRRNTET